MQDPTKQELEKVIARPPAQTNALRKSGLGGSDMAAVIGVDPYRSPLDVWLEKTGRELPPALDDNDVVWFGKEAESLVAQYFTRRTGRRTIGFGDTHRLPTHQYIMANPDRVLLDDTSSVTDEGLEIKTAGYFVARDQWGEEGTDEIPEQYLVQCHHYNMVMNWSVCHVALLAGRDLKLYRVERSLKWDSIIVEAAEEFWYYVDRRQMPKFQFNDLSLRALRRMYPTPKPNEWMEADKRLASLVMVREELSKRISDAETSRAVCEAMLLEQTKDAEWLILPDGFSLKRIHVDAGVVPEYTRPAYSYYRRVKTPKSVQALAPHLITHQETKDE